MGRGEAVSQRARLHPPRAHRHAVRHRAGGRARRPDHRPLHGGDARARRGGRLLGHAAPRPRAGDHHPQAQAVVVDPAAHRVSIVSAAPTVRCARSRTLLRAPRHRGRRRPRRSPCASSPRALQRRRFPAGHRDDRLSRHRGRPHRPGAEQHASEPPGRLHAARGAGRLRDPEPHDRGGRAGLRPGPAAAQALRRPPARHPDRRPEGPRGRRRPRKAARRAPTARSRGSASTKRVAGARARRARAAPRKWHVYEINVQVAWGDSKRAVGVSTPAHGLGRRARRRPPADDRRASTASRLHAGRAADRAGHRRRAAGHRLRRAQVAVEAWRQGEDRAEAHQHVRSMALILARAVSATHPYRASRGQATRPGGALRRARSKRMEFVTQAAPFPGPTPDRLHRGGLRARRGRRAGLVVRQRALPNREPFIEAEIVYRDPSVTALKVAYLDEGRLEGQLGRRGGQGPAARREDHARPPGSTVATRSCLR